MAENQYQEGYLKTVPTPNKMTVTNLVNFSEAGGVYGETNKTVKRIGVSFLIVLLYLFVLWLFFSFIRVWWLMIPMAVVLIPLPLRLISLIVFKEREVAKDYKNREGSLATVSSREFFSCFDISDMYPYYMYHTDGSLSVVLELVRRTQVGEVTKKAFAHAEVLSNFYNQAFKRNIEVTDLDIQSSNTKDVRFDTLYAHLSDVKNSVIESILASMYQHLELNSNRSVLSYEYFVLRSTDREDVFLDNISMLVSGLQDGYKRVSVLPESKVSVLISSLFGLESFAMKDAMQDVASYQGQTSLKLLWVGNKEGKRRKINDSQAEIHNKMVGGAQKPKLEVDNNKTKIDDGAENQLVDLFATESEVKEVGMTSILNEEESVYLSEVEPTQVGSTGNLFEDDWETESTFKK